MHQLIYQLKLIYMYLIKKKQRQKNLKFERVYLYKYYKRYFENQLLYRVYFTFLSTKIIIKQNIKENIILYIKKFFLFIFAVLLHFFSLVSFCLI